MSFIMSVTNRIQNQIPLLILNPPLKKAGGRRSEPEPETPRTPEQAFPLGMVLDACPDIVDYAKGGISNWRDFVATAAIGPLDARDQPQRLGGGARGDGRNPGGDRRGGDPAARPGDQQRRRLSAQPDRKARAGKFSLGPMLMALIGGRKRAANEKMTA